MTQDRKTKNEAREHAVLHHERYQTARSHVDLAAEGGPDVHRAGEPSAVCCGCGMRQGENPAYPVFYYPEVAGGDYFCTTADPHAAEPGCRAHAVAEGPR